MKISVYSDLHTEFDVAAGNPPYVPPFNPEVEVMIIAGDCFVADRGFEWVNMLMEVHRDTPHVLFIPGNHDFYGCHFMDLFDKTMNGFDEVYPNFHYMNRRTETFEGINFIGAPLWTSFDAYGPLAEHDVMSSANFRLADFSEIAGMSAGGMQKIARRDQKFFSDELFKRKGDRNICISHWPPLIECKNENFETNILSPYFNNDLSDMIKNTDCEVWVYAHNHYNQPFDLYDTHFTSNQRGYASMGESARIGKPFDEHFVIEV